MPNLPRVHKPAHAKEHKPYANSRMAHKRITGRALQERNYRIKLRDKWVCYVCGRVTQDGHVDHKVALAQGGTEQDDNLGWICIDPCHRMKSRREAIEGKRK